MEIKVIGRGSASFEVFCDKEHKMRFYADEEPIGQPPIFLIYQCPSSFRDCTLAIKFQTRLVDYRNLFSEAKDLAHQLAREYANSLVEIVDNTSRAKSSTGDGASYIPSCGDDTVMTKEHLGKKDW